MRRIPFFALFFALFALAGPAGAVTAATGGAVLVMESGAASLAAIDMRTQTVRERLPVLREPHHWALSPDHRTLLVGDSAGNEILFLNPVNFHLERRLTISDPYQLGFSPDGKYLVVNGLARNQVDIYDAATYRLVKRFALGTMPSHMAFAPDSGRVFITLQGTNSIAAIDLRRMQLLWKRPVGPAPAGIIWLHGKLLIADMGADYVMISDPATGAELGRIVTGNGTHQIFLSPDGSKVWVNNRVAGTVSVLDAASLKVERVYNLPGGPDDLAFAPDGHVWFTLRFVAKVAVLDPVTGTYTTIVTHRSPHGIFLNPAGHVG